MAEPHHPSFQKSNRLLREKSPYLLQHAYNPVAWYPWGEEAFTKARQEGKPIFLSIGYSTCHWCHVMERESFSDHALAQVMNEHFVSIKVDREERPDVDHLYMQFVMQTTGQGGWPLNVFLTPDLKPFFGGTYFPPEDRWGKPGFKSLLLGVSKAWKERREEIVRSSEELTQGLAMQETLRKAEGPDLGEATLIQAFQQYSARFDETQGGFGEAPKFPASHSLSFLLRYGKRTGDAQALEMVEKTLQKMAAGGIWDHLGGGFHRYSTDARWHIPHFEKMLYDQALLSKSYLEAYQATGKKEYALTAREVFDYILREMTSPKGGFYSAEDADSVIDPAHPEEKGEGAFYVWTEKEILDLLGAEKGKEFNRFYGVTSAGNAEDPLGELKGKNVLHQAEAVPAPIEKAVAESKKILWEARNKRPRPQLDDKILVDWNGLMISSLAFGSRVLEEPRYRVAAEQAAQFILAKLTAHPELVEEERLIKGRLLHRYRDGEAGILGGLDDYAFFIHGLVDLYEATFQPEYLAQAKRLTLEMIRLFWDQEKGGFFMVGEDAEKLLIRPKEVYDGAIPSGNSVAALDLIRVGRLTQEQALEKKAEALLKTFSGEISTAASAFPQALMALDFAMGPANEIVIAGDAQDPQLPGFLRKIYRPFLPNKVVAFHPVAGKEMAQIEQLVPFLKEQKSLGGKTTVYLCENYACNLPVTSVEELEKLLK